MARVYAFMATSLDGFIAGPNDELDWLDGFDGAEDTFTPFFAGIGAMLVGRRTYDAVSSMDVDWPYGDTPFLVATRRPLQSPIQTVRAVVGSLPQMLAEAKATAGDRGVYLDGGTLVREALDQGLLDEIIVTVIPRILGDGVPLFAGCGRRHSLDLISTRPIGAGLVELHYRTRSTTA